jgi:acetyl esterase/lipase
MSWQSHIFRSLLRIFRVFQKNAPIEATRRAARYGETAIWLPRGVRCEQLDCNGVPCEWYIPPDALPDAAILYFHGGGFVMPLYHVSRNVMGHVAKLSHVRVLAVNYRLAPQHPFPAPLEDCAAAYRYLIDVEALDPARIVVTGESAGANLTLTALLHLRDQGAPMPAGVAPISAALDLEGGSDFFRITDVMIHPDFVLKMFRAYIGAGDPHNPLINPLTADLRGLPPMLIQGGERECFRGDMELLAEHARRDGIEATLTLYPGMWHYWHLLVDFMPEARAAVEELAAWARARIGEM